MACNIINTWSPRILWCAVTRPSLPALLLNCAITQLSNDAAVRSRQIWAEINHVDLGIRVEGWDQEGQIHLAVVVAYRELPSVESNPLRIPVLDALPSQVETIKVALICLWQSKGLAQSD